jgi:hypothetical protein
MVVGIVRLRTTSHGVKKNVMVFYLFICLFTYDDDTHATIELLLETGCFCLARERRYI